MSKTLLAVLGFFGLGILLVVVLLGMGVSFHNKEVKLRNLIVNKQTDNKNEMDAMWKNISQVAQVAEKDRSSLMELFNGYAQGRAGGRHSRRRALHNVQVREKIRQRGPLHSPREGPAGRDRQA